MKHRSRLSFLGVAFALTACASTHDRDRDRDRSRHLYERVPDARSGGEEPPPVPEDLTNLEGYVRHGTLYSAELRAVYEEWRARTERVEQVSSLPDPSLSYGEFLEEIQTRTGPQERRFGLRQAFPWPGELDARARVADREAEAAWRRVEGERARVVEAIELAFYDYAFLGQQERITRELGNLLRGLEPVVRGRVRGGGGQEDLLRLQVEIGRIEDDLASIERRRPALSARLAQAAQLPRSVGVLPLPELEEPEAHAVPLDEVHRQALESNPRLLMLTEEWLAHQEAEELTQYRRRPNFSVGVDYIQTGEATNSGTPGSGDDPLMVGLSLSLPIWTASYSAGEREARHRVRAARERLTAAESDLRAQVEELAYRVDDAGRRMGLYRDTLIPRASEALDLTLASYRTGGASVLDLIDSERALLEFELSFWGACREYVQSEARLKALMGRGTR